MKKTEINYNLPTICALFPLLKYLISHDACRISWDTWLDE